MDKVKICDLDFVYISFKEPNKEENWADLKNKVPWAKRVDGVVGFDYGNGGIVGWPKQTCLDMKTHENSETEENNVDFCWGVPHENLWNCYSTTVINSDPRQAFVAGYREGVKMSLDKGKPMSADIFRKRIWSENLRKLCTWMSVGADTDHGRMAMLGARMGCYDTVFGDDDLLKVRELDHLEQIYLQRTKEIDIDEELIAYGESLRQRLDIPVAEYDSNESKFFKYAMPPHKNMGVQARER